MKSTSDDGRSNAEDRLVLENEPHFNADALDWLRNIREARGKGMLRVPSDAECGEKGDEEQHGKHWRPWQMA